MGRSCILVIDMDGFLVVVISEEVGLFGLGDLVNFLVFCRLVLDVLVV